MPIPRVGIPLHDAVGDDFADVFGFGELIDTRGEDGVEVREAASERLGDACADVQDAESVKDAPHVAGFAGFDAVEEIAGGLFAHAFEIGEVVQLESIEVGNVLHQSVLDQLGDQHFAAALDVHRAAGAPMLDPAADLGRAIGIGAAPHRRLAFRGCAFGYF